MPEKEKTNCIEVRDSHSVIVFPPSTKKRESKIYKGFSQVFSADSSQEEVYAEMVTPLVEEFIRGKSGLLAALGPSGSGKTHTIFGSAREPGLLPRALRHIFQPSVGSQDRSKRSFHLSMFEIYVDNGKMEKLLDLSPNGGDIKLQHYGLKGLNEFLITDHKQAEDFIEHAMLRRATAATKLNIQSSRSQCIISIRCSIDMIDGKDQKVITQVNEAVLTFVDLAGSEKEKRTENLGGRLVESNFINKTSMVFGHCLRSLLEHQKNPKKPLSKHFQDSLLTRYMRDYMEGKKRMALILTVNPAEEDYQDTSFLLQNALPYMEIKFDTSQSKRHYETMINDVSQSKRMKVSCPTDSMVLENNNTELEIELSDMKSSCECQKEASVEVASIVANVCKTGSDCPGELRSTYLKSYCVKMGKSLIDQSSAVFSYSGCQSTEKNEKLNKYFNIDRGSNFSSVSESKKMHNHEKTTVETKHKRRLMPAPSVLLIHGSRLDFKD